MEGREGSSEEVAAKRERWEARRDLVPDPLGERDFEEFWQKYQAHRGQWREQAEALENRLRELLEPLKHVRCIYRPVYARVKSFTSMVQSAHDEWKKDAPPGENFQWNSVMQLGDVVGARVAGLNLTDVIRIVRRILAAEDFPSDKSEVKNFYERAKESGYRSWQVQLAWHPDKRKYSVEGRRIEIQVRTILDDAWAEWDHQVLYKRPSAVKREKWDTWKRSRKGDRERLAQTIRSISDEMDRFRQEFYEGYLSRVPEHIDEHLDSFQGEGEPSSKVLDLLGRPPFSAEVLGGKFSTGLSRDQVQVIWDPDWFHGLEIDEASYRPEQRQRFTFRKLFETKKGLRLKVDDKDVERYLARNDFAGKARDLLVCCYREKAGAHRTFFNEYEARLRDYLFSGPDPLQTGLLKVEIAKTNFAYEVCTTYMLEQKRTIVRDESGAEDKKVAELKAPLKAILSQVPFAPYPFSQAANPIGVHVNLICISHDRKSPPQLIVMRRGGESALHPHQWSTAVSGVMCPVHESIESGGDIPDPFHDPEGCMEKDHKPCLFRAAQRELEEEIEVHVPVDHIRVIALMRDVETGQPILVVEAYTEKEYEEIEAVRGVAEEAWEVDRLVQIPLDEDGLRSVFSELVVHQPKSGTERKICLPKPDRTSLNGSAGEEVWQPRSAAAVVLTLCRYFGSGPLEKYLLS